MNKIRVAVIALAFALTSSLIAVESIPTSPKTEQSTTNTSKRKLQNFDIRKVYGSSPVIYSILLLMSSSALAIWFYTQATFRTKDIMPPQFLQEIRRHLNEKNYEDAYQLCQSQTNLLASIISVGLTTRSLGAQVMIDSMKSEGKRISSPFWHRLSILNDIAIIAPMLGLLGTVIGMFYAFYDVNRSVDSINAVFDGLGISVGTTVVGLIVAILSMILVTTLKYRLLNTFSLVENEALVLSAAIETK